MWPYILAKATIVLLGPKLVDWAKSAIVEAKSRSETYDYDLDLISQSVQVPPHNSTPIPEWMMEVYGEPAGIPDLDTAEGLDIAMRIPRYVMCEGVPLEVGKHQDLEDFMTIKDRAYLYGVYNSVPFDQGGEEKLWIDWFRLLGVSEWHANTLIKQGERPWAWKWC